jgi:flagellar hook-associated protein 3 FlgL
MSERITPEMVRSTTLTSINESLEAVQRSSEELSSGKKILQASDNPVGTSEIINLNYEIEGLNSYSNGISNGQGWLQTATSAMGNISEILQRVRELLVEGSNGTTSEENLRSFGVEVTHLTEAVKQDANTQYAGQYVFSGSATSTKPYNPGTEDEYHGNGEEVLRAIGPGSTVNVAMGLGAVMGSGPGAADGKLLDVLRTIATNLTEASPEARAKLNTTDLKNLEANIEGLNNLQAASGSTIDQLKTAEARIEGLQTTLTKALSNVQDANIAEVSIAYSSEQAAYSAALRVGATIVQESLLNFLQ